MFNSESDQKTATRVAITTSHLLDACRDNNLPFVSVDVAVRCATDIVLQNLAKGEKDAS